MPTSFHLLRDRVFRQVYRGRSLLARVALAGIGLVLAAGCGDTLFSPTPTITPQPSSTPIVDAFFAELRQAIEDVPGSDGHGYSLTDDQGASLDTAKIIADPQGQGGYLAVYHSNDGSHFEAHLASSSDLLTWHRLRSFGAGTQQPYLTEAPGQGFLLALEITDGSNNWLQVRYYPSRADLLANRAIRVFDVPHTQVPANQWAEGTPSIESVSFHPDVDHSTVEIGFHYWKDGDVDRQAHGILTNFTGWVSDKRYAVDASLLNFGLQGNLGDRDMLLAAERTYWIYEGQAYKNDFSSWRVYLTSDLGDPFVKLDIHTDAGSTAFANPTLTLVPSPSGGRRLIVTLFLPHEGAAPGEAGELVYFRDLP